MTEIASIQNAFADGLINYHLPPPAFLKAARGTPGRRFEVYRNNVFAGLTGVLESRFPVVSRILGAEFFRGFACQFIERHPPQSPALVFYGSNFADYMRASEDCAEVPYLAGVASIEWELHRCYHAADDVILTADDLTRDGSTPEAMTFRWAASAGIVCSQYPAYGIWRANARAEQSRPLRLIAQAETVLITRRGLGCDAVLMPPGGAEFARSLSAGETLSQASLRAARSAGDFRLDQVLGLLLRQNAFASSRNKV